MGAEPGQIAEINKPDLYIVSGGPGAGKTTVLAELARLGFRCIPEVARKLIQEEMQAGGDALPWGNRIRYAQLMLERSIAVFHKAELDIAFCDRGIPDTLCYLRLIGGNDAEAVVACKTFRYARKVLLAPPWKKIYAVDTERKQTFAEAVRTFDLMVSVYAECGYEIEELPLTSPARRAEFILQQISATRSAR